ncbi:hypothetical protein [Hymenobacter radiodurans]|uniref:hypothetical protein n=1 Tax=Hymenobacter radiodurans TaxID=2496028 RepID=UPI001F1065F8|nr:hypothetical protein [Hymenobacter radiodurans]
MTRIILTAGLLLLAGAFLPKNHLLLRPHPLAAPSPHPLQDASLTKPPASRSRRPPSSFQICDDLQPRAPMAPSASPIYPKVVF